MSGGQQQNNDNGELLVIFFGLAIVIAIYFFAGVYIKEYYVNIKLWQLTIINTIFPIQSNTELIAFIKNNSIVMIDKNTAITIGNRVSYFLNPLLLIFIVISLTYIRNNLFLSKKFNKNYSRKELLQQEKEEWCFLMPIADLNLDKVDPTTGDWASAKKPQTIVMDYRLLNKPNDLNSLNEDKALKYFHAQLGKLLIDLDSLPTVQKALLGCFFAHYKLEKDIAYNAMLEISKSFSPKSKPNFEAGLKLFEEYKNDEKILKIAKRHAYVYTFFAEIFNQSKSKGVIVTRYFIWLKPLDRQLYLLLNSVGREVPFVEVAGIFSHWQYEKRLKRAMQTIFAEDAIIGLKEELFNVKLKESED